MQRLRQIALLGAVFFYISFSAVPLASAPYAAMVMDARSGKVLHARNADTRLHPASLTKMMTLYVVFDAVRRGEITLDTKVRVSKHAASEPPSKLYLKAGQRVALRHLIRASAVKSANDAATAMAEAISGSEAAFAKRMTRTARALGMNNTTFKNAHGLTQAGHLSTARDMTKLGRALFYHFPDYYNLFSRRSTTAAGVTVNNTNRRLLNAYKGADGIKTGYTRAAGYNLVASAKRGRERIIATMFGGTSGAARNARVAELLDMGFKRAPSRVAVSAPSRPNLAIASLGSTVPTGPAGQKAKSIRVTTLIVKGTRPRVRPNQGTEPAATQIASADPAATGAEATAAATPEAAQAAQSSLAASTAGLAVPDTTDAVAQALLTPTPPAASENVQTADASAPRPKPNPKTVVPQAEAPQEQQVARAIPTERRLPRPVPVRRPAVITFSSSDGAERPAPEETQVAAVSVPRISASGGKHWGINVGTYASQYEAERMLLKTALIEIETLDSALRKVVRKNTGFDANFVGLDERTAELACARLSARDQSCKTLQP